MSGVCLSLINCCIFTENATRFSKSFQTKQSKSLHIGIAEKYPFNKQKFSLLGNFFVFFGGTPLYLPSWNFFAKMVTLEKNFFRKKDPALRQEQGRTYEREI
jgi:hypothetical protein